jgi:hypothetical protein
MPEPIQDGSKSLVALNILGAPTYDRDSHVIRYDAVVEGEGGARRSSSPYQGSEPRVDIGNEDPELLSGCHNLPDCLALVGGVKVFRSANPPGKVADSHGAMSHEREGRVREDGGAIRASHHVLRAAR